MSKQFVRVLGVALLLMSEGSPAALGQKATEMYIPVGQSPGLSGKYTLIGKIEAINARDGTLTLSGPSGTRTATVAPRTQIWLDRSKLKLTNLKGTLADLRKGLTVEVKYANGQMAKGAAEWIKVQITEPS